MMSMGRSIHAQTVGTIAGWIINGRFREGENLPIEPAICAELGVSRTVVREAIKTLAAKGLVSTGPRIGTRVLPRGRWNLFDERVVEWRLQCGVDATFIQDLMALRLAIEPAAAMLAARQAAPAARAAVMARYAGMIAAEAGDDRAAYVEADLAFHAGILDATGNQFFASLAPMISSVLKVSFTLSTGNPEAIRQSLPNHRAVAEAIARGDGAEAAARLTALIEQARHDLEAIALPRAGPLPGIS